MGYKLKIRLPKSTPGPWKMDDWTVWGPKGEEIAALADEAGPFHRAAGEKRKPGEKSHAIARANAALLAAAPEMFAALVEARDVIRTQNDGNCLASIITALAKVEEVSKQL